jgi:hypothetical protein
MRFLRFCFPLAFVAAAACSSTNPGATGGNASSTSSGNTTSTASGSEGGGPPMGDASAPDSGPVVNGPPQVLTPTRPSTRFGQTLGLSHDGKVLMASALDSGAVTDADYDRFPVYAFEAPAGAFSAVCQLPGLQKKDIGKQGELLALNGDGKFAAMHEWLGNPAAITLLQRVNGCWNRTGFQKEVDVDFEGDYDAVSVSSDGTTVIAGTSRDSLAPLKHDTDYDRAGKIPVWTTAGDTGYRAPMRRQNGSFGTSAVVSADGSMAFVGEPQFAANKADYPQGEPYAHGSAYVLDLKNNGIALATLNATNWATQAGFGKAIAASADGRFIVVGAPDEKSLDESGTNLSDTSSSGAAYLFEKEGATWTQRRMFKPEKPAEAINGEFGKQVAISDDGNTVVVGASFYKPELSGSVHSGAIYIFKRDVGTSWAHRVLDGADYPMQEFGAALALDGSGHRLVVGAPAWDVGKADASGAVLIYAL